MQDNDTLGMNAVAGKQQRVIVSLLENDRDTGEVFCAAVASSRTCELGGWYTSLPEARDGVSRDGADIVFVDLDVPGGRGSDLIKSFHGRSNSPEFVIYTNFASDDYVFEAFCAGASGYLLKYETEATAIDDFVAMMQRGEAPMSGQIARRCLEFFHPSQNHPLSNKLTTREFEVLERLANGESIEQIAEILGISVKTVRPHCRAIYKKLGVNNRFSAVRMYYQSRLQKLLTWSKK